MSLLPPTTQGLILDMDGVLWVDTAPIGNLPAIFERIKELGLSVSMATNNSTRTVDMYVERLMKLGVQVDAWQVVTSSLAAADMMSGRLPQGAPVFAIGEKGLLDVLQAAQFELLPVEKARHAEAVVIGFDREISFEKMNEAALLIRAGKPFFATNPDKTFPTPRGQIPGAGAWVNVLTSATDVQPSFAGKPYPYILEMALKRMGTARAHTFVVGDRLETDIAGGQALGCPTALVLSGVSTPAQASAWVPKIDIIAASLAALVGAAD